MKKILELQGKLTPKNDKLGHFFWGFWYALFGVLMHVVFSWIYWIVIPSVILAASKEFWDSRGNGNVEFLDFLFTIIPSAALFLIAYMI
ncbi:hypothetical protein PL373_14730 [Tenacibaculum maritimum]|nr:hypothetical protein [Tenacibaculum maritimum]MDB0602374.1 hypothetical protein [Tenacibaculum maritimum]MDB0613465.1 hypothetical protein [Tenacibaculum maritimum]